MTFIQVVGEKPFVEVLRKENGKPRKPKGPKPRVEIFELLRNEQWPDNKKIITALEQMGIKGSNRTITKYRGILHASTKPNKGRPKVTYLQSDTARIRKSIYYNRGLTTRELLQILQKEEPPIGSLHHAKPRANLGILHRHISRMRNEGIIDKKHIQNERLIQKEAVRDIIEGEPMLSDKKIILCLKVMGINAKKANVSRHRSLLVRSSMAHRKRGKKRCILLSSDTAIMRRTIYYNQQLTTTELLEILQSQRPKIKSLHHRKRKYNLGVLHYHISKMRKEGIISNQSVPVSRAVAHNAVNSKVDQASTKPSPGRPRYSLLSSQTAKIRKLIYYNQGLTSKELLELLQKQKPKIKCFNNLNQEININALHAYICGMRKEGIEINLKQIPKTRPFIELTIEQEEIRKIMLPHIKNIVWHLMKKRGTPIEYREDFLTQAEEKSYFAAVDWDRKRPMITFLYSRFDGHLKGFYTVRLSRDLGFSTTATKVLQSFLKAKRENKPMEPVLERFKKTREEAEEMMEAYRSLVSKSKHIQKNGDVFDEDKFMTSSLADAERDVIQSLMVKKILGAMKGLTNLERNVILKEYGFDFDPKEVGVRLIEEERQIMNGALAKLRKTIVTK